MKTHNFVRVHKTLRMTPAMAAGVTKRLWEISDVVDVLEAWEAAAMLKISDFIKHAADCREMAKRTTSQVHKAQLEQMARTWEELAEERKNFWSVKNGISHNQSSPLPG
jgi:hypothetical protein